MLWTGRGWAVDQCICAILCVLAYSHCGLVDADVSADKHNDDAHEYINKQARSYLFNEIPKPAGRREGCGWGWGANIK